MINKEYLSRCIPVVTIKEFKDTDKIISALRDFGIPNAEITFRTACAKEAITYAVQKYPEMNIGAGTIINAKQCKEALKTGAKFIVSPGLSEEVAKICVKKGVPYYPGAITPTEIMKAINLGITTVKYFPSNFCGGLPAMKALSGPFAQVKFIPTCGITEENMGEFLDWEKTFAVGASFFVKLALDAKGETL